MDLKTALITAHDNGFAVINYNDLRRELRARRISDTRLLRAAGFAWEELCDTHSDLPRHTTFTMKQFKLTTSILLIREKASGDQSSAIGLDATIPDEGDEND